MKKSLFSTIALLLIVAILAGCVAAAPAAPAGGESAAAAEQPAAPAVDAERASTVYFDIDGGPLSDPTLWNPYSASGRLDQGLAQAMIEPLFLLNFESADGEIIPWLADSLTPNDDFSLWTLKLKSGIQWSDGQALTAADVIFTVDMIRNTPEINTRTTFDGLDSMNQVDDQTVEFKLAAPDNRFMLKNFVVRQGNGVSIVPKHIWEGQDPLTFSNFDAEKGWPVFSGPYLLESATENQVTYTRNDQWWGAAAGMKLPKPAKLVWLAFGSEETRTAALSKGELDSAMGMSLGAFLAAQKANPSVVAWTAEEPFSWLDPCARDLDFNHTVAPWDDPEMRWAINYALDRSQIVDIAYEGITTPSRHFFAGFAPLNRYLDLLEPAGTFDKYAIETSDPDKAKSIIESKGYVMNASSGYYEKDGQELKVTITNFDSPEMSGLGGIIVEQLQTIGINAVQDTKQIPDFIDSLLNAKFEMYVFFGSCGSVNDPWNSLDSFSVRHIPANAGEGVSGFYANTFRWNTETAQKYSDIVAQIGELPVNDPAVDQLFVDAMDLWYSELPIIPLVQAPKLVPFNTGVWQGWPTAADPYIQPATWWQSTHVILQHLEPAQ